MKIKSTALVLVLYICIFTSLHAQQRIAVGVRGGLTIPDISGDQNNPLQKGYSSRSGVGFGVFAEYKLSNLFSLQPMLEYSQQGARSKGHQALPYDPSQYPDDFNELIQYLSNGQTPAYFYANFNVDVKINYLLLPVLAKFGWSLGHNSRWRIYADAGPFVGLVLNARERISGGNTKVFLDADEQNPITNPYTQETLVQNFDTAYSIRPDIHKFNFGIEGNVGIAYKFKKNTIFLEGGGNYGLLNIQKHAADGKNHSGAATIMIGYTLTLGK